MSQPLPDQGRPWPMYAAIGAAVALIALTLYFAGSRGGDSNDETAETEDAAATLQRRCEQDLTGILAAVDPTRLGVSSRPGDRAGDLNVWRTGCSNLLAEEPITQDQELKQELLAEEVASRVAQPEFSSQDVRHLRTALLARQVAEHIAGDVDDPLRQATELFDFVSRSVLDPVGFEAPAATPYEALLIGRGSAPQRVWLFAELLRQMRIDAVLLQPTAEGETGSPRFVGVLAKRGGKVEVYVFDVLIGLPIPAPEEAESEQPFVQQPATLAQIQADDQLLRRLDAPEQPYPFSAEQFENLKVGLIGESSMWSERMAQLDFATDWRGATFYEGLGPNRLQTPSLHERVRAAGEQAGWKAADISVWSFPEESLQSFESGANSGVLGQFREILAGPYPRQEFEQFQKQDPDLRWNVSLQKARDLHITGAFKDALQEYRQIREAQGYFALSPLNDWCRESAAYWTAGCQYELGAYDSVRNSAATYPPPFQTPAQPLWADGVLKLAAYGSAKLGDYRSAVGLMSQPQAVRSHGTEYLMRRWMRLGGLTPAEAPAESTPATPPKASSEDAPAATPQPASKAAPEENAPAPEPEASATPSDETPAAEPATDEPAEEAGT